MGSLLGFRGPHFSEEEAWLPGWLQQPGGRPVDEVIDEGESCFEKRIQELQLLGENFRKEANSPLLSSNEGGYQSCRLFLSADSNSPFSSAPSTENVVHFRLHLSNNDGSESMLSLIEETSQTERSVLKQSLDASIPPQRECNKFNAELNSNIQPSTPKSTLGCKISVDISQKERHDEPEISDGADISSAIELSIAASEATVIHEVIRNIPLSDYLSSSAVLEVALQLKQARLGAWKEAFFLSTEHSSEDGILTDLDDATMRDAYDDVGMSVSDLENTVDHVLSISHSRVNNPTDGKRHSEEFKYEDVVLESDCSKSDEKFMNRRCEDTLEGDVHRKDFLLNSIEWEREYMLEKDPAVTLHTNSMACQNDLKVSYQCQQNSHVSTSVETNNFAAGEKNLFQVPQTLQLANNFENAGQECEVNNIVPDRFHSRWCGGWTWKPIGKEVKSYAAAGFENKGIPKPYIRETSFLSESADVAPDENSAVQKQDKEKSLASQSSIPSVCNNIANDEMLFSQEIIKSPGLSNVDPLCSFVPCSLSSENICTNSSVHCGDEGLAGGIKNPTAENAMQSVQTASGSDGVLLVDELAVPDSLEGVQPAVCRQISSLRNFSMLLPSQGSYLEKEINGDKSVLASKNVKTNLLCRQTSGVHLRDGLKCDETVKDQADLPNLMRKKTNSPIILSCGKRRRLQASNIDVDEVLNQTSLPEQLPGLEHLHKGLPNSGHHMISSIPASKRVRFSETEIPRKEGHQEQQPSAPSYHDRKINKNSKRCDARTGSRARECKQQLKCRREQDSKKKIFQNMEFLLTGLSCQKEKAIENLIKKYGGMVLFDIPSPPTSRAKRKTRSKAKTLPVVICTRKLQTIKFLYGCAAKAPVLKVNWLTDSVSAGSLLPPHQYMIHPKTVSRRFSRLSKTAQYDCHDLIFNGVGIMLHGISSFCSEMAKVIKHGGGQVYKSLQWLVQSVDTKKISTGILVSEDESRTSRHLRQCALEKNIAVVPASWIMKSLQRGKLLPLKKNKAPAPLPPLKPLDYTDSFELSMEI